MIVVDTGVLVALLDADDNHHQSCRNWYVSARGPLIMPSPVMVEACYFIERDSGPETEASFLRSFDGEAASSQDAQPFMLAEIQHEDRMRMAELVEQYAASRSVRSMPLSPQWPNGWRSRLSLRSTTATSEPFVPDM